MAEYAVIIPTLNEKDNILPTIERLESVLSGLDWEVVFVDDDSSDGTWQNLISIAAQNPRVRLLRRVGRRGLSSACVEGMNGSPFCPCASPYPLSGEGGRLFFAQSGTLRAPEPPDTQPTGTINANSPGLDHEESRRGAVVYKAKNSVCPIWPVWHNRPGCPL